jgi:excisionase family DNA binding protein
MHKRYRTGMTPNTNPEPLMTVTEAGRLLRISRGRAYELARTGELPVVRIGRSVRVRRDKLAAWIDQHTGR